MKYYCKKNAIPFKKKDEPTELAINESKEEENTDIVYYDRFTVSRTFIITDYPLRDSILFDPSSDLYIYNDLIYIISPIRPI